MLHTFHYDSPLGGIVLASDGNALTGLWFGEQKYSGNSADTGDAGRDEGKVPRRGILPVFADTIRWLDIYFNGKDPAFVPALGLDVSGASDFRKKIWDILLTIPYGQTMSYGEIANIYAKKNGLKKMSAQAVGGAVGHNPISLIVPCHRVIGSDGSLTGYGGGLDKKTRLLELENALK